MFKRLTMAIWILVLLSACSVFSQAQPAPTNIPTLNAFASTAAPATTPVPALAVPTVERTATLTPDPSTSSGQAPATGSGQVLPALWVIDGTYNRLVALDPQTGRVLNQVTSDFESQVSSHDGRRQYSLVIKPKDRRWQVTLSRLDLTRSAGPTYVLLSDQIPITTGSEREVSPGHLLLSTDERQLYVIQAQRLGEQWHTRLYVVDVTTGKVSQPAEISTSEGTYVPAVQTVLSSDERRLFVLQNFQRQAPAAKDDPAVWFTRITVLNAGGSVKRVVEVPGDVKAHGYWLNVMPAPDGKRLYLLQEIVRGSERDGYRFVTFDLDQQAIAFTRLVERSSNGELGCGTWGLQFTADGRYLYGYCGPDHPIRPAGFVQYLDTQAGMFDPKVVLESKAGPGQASVYGISHVLPSPDGKLLYIASWRSREVFVFDVTRRNVVRQAILKDTRPASANPLSALFAAMANWFVGTAHAKFYAQPAVLLSPDGQRLYVVDVKDFDKGDGLWAVETATLKVLGHWLAGKDIYGIQLSADGRELFAASPSDASVQVLDALTGEPRRVLKSEQTLVKPLGFAAAQSQ